MQKGANYDGNMTTKDIAKLLRKEIKTIAPNTKWSITSDYSRIKVNLMEAPFEVFMPENTHKDSGYLQINEYYLNDMHLTPEAVKIFKEIKEFLWSFNYDDSDSMVDYFDRKFYEYFAIGKWDKPFILK